jgi:hypothetical protein
LGKNGFHHFCNWVSLRLTLTQIEFVPMKVWWTFMLLTFGDDDDLLGKKSWYEALQPVATS